MIKQDYLIRMIQEIISLIYTALINKKKLKKDEWIEYDSISRQIMGFDASLLVNMDVDEIIEKYKEDNDRTDKLEMTAMIMLKMAEETKDNLLVKSRLRQNGIELLKYVDQTSSVFSLQRKQILNLISINK